MLAHFNNKRQFARPSGNGRFLRETDGSSPRKPLTARCRPTYRTWSAEFWNVLAPPRSEKWSDPLTDVQRRLFEHATSGKSGDAAQTRIARFLHNHKDALDSHQFLGHCRRRKER